MMEIKPRDIIVCPTCKKQFFPKNGNQRYCSKECKDEARRQRDRNRTKTILCLRCGKEFIAKYNSNRVLCDACREAEEKEKKRRLAMAIEASKMRKNCSPIQGAFRTPAENPRNKVTIITPKDDEQPKPKIHAKVKVDISKMVKPPLSPTHDSSKIKVTTNRFDDPMQKFKSNIEADRSGEEFTEQEDELIQEMIEGGSTYTEVAITTGRTPIEIKCRHEKLKKINEAY